MKTIPQIGKKMVALLHETSGVYDPRFRSGLLSWLAKKDNHFIPIWISIAEHDFKDVIRFTNQKKVALPKKQWPHLVLPNKKSVELTAIISECDNSLLTTVINHFSKAIDQYNDKTSLPAPSAFGDGPCQTKNGWTPIAYKTSRDRHLK